MALTVGVVGPEDLVQRVMVVGAPSGAALVPLPYRHETEAVELVEQAHERSTRSCSPASSRTRSPPRPA